MIADTSVLITFEKAKQLDILHKIYQNIFITAEIAQEFGAPLPLWIKIEPIKDQKYLTFIHTRVDIGEATAIAPTVEKGNPLIIK